MRRYTLVIDGRTFTIDVAETTSDTFEVSVDGQTFEAALTGDHDLPGGAISPQMPVPEGHPDTSSSPAPVVIGARPDQRPLSGRGPDLTATGARLSGSPTVAERAPAPAGRGGIVAAPMPGVVLAILVEAGTTVCRGDPLLVLEAMKMRNTIRAPRDGTVADVVVAVGGHVASGAPMVRIVAPSG